MFARLFLLIVVLPLAELAGLIWLGTRTSPLVPIGLVIATGLGGAWLARRQGFQTVGRLQADMAAGRMPADTLLDGLLLFVAAILLIMPGVLTDVAAIVLLVPYTRRLVKLYMATRMRARVQVNVFGRAPQPAEHDQIIDVKVIEAPRRNP